MITNCIDVSTWNVGVDYNKVRNAGIKAVIIRAGFGRETSQKDNQFETHYKNAKSAGLKIGIYWYSYAVSVEDAKREAQACLFCIKGKQIDLPVYFDMEESSMTRLGRNTLTSMAKAFCEEIKNAGLKAGVYANPNWFSNYLDYNDLKSRYSIWLAQWGVANPSYECDIWQYADNGKINGVAGNCDVNVIRNSALLNGTTSNPTQTSTPTTTIKYSKAVEDWQKAVNAGFDYTGDILVVDGLFGNACKAFATKHQLFKGITNTQTAVKWLQKQLNITADGIFGNDTEKAVKNFQSKKKLTSDGIVGINTYKAILGV